MTTSRSSAFPAAGRSEVEQRWLAAAAVAESGRVSGVPVAEVVEVAWSDPRAVEIRAAMDAEMAARYPAPPSASAASHDVFAVDPADAVVTCLALLDGEPVGHGALRWLGDDLEVKKIVVLEGARGHGLSYRVMGFLTDHARALGAPRLVLQTGWNQPESVHVYEKLGFTPIPLLDRYAAYPRSICLALDL